MGKYDKIKKQHNEISYAEKKTLDIAVNGMDEIAADIRRVEEIYNNPEPYLDDIDARFMKATGINNKQDISFLMLATALQVARWALITKVYSDKHLELIEKAKNENRLKHDDKSIKAWQKKENQDYIEKHQPKDLKDSKHRNVKNIIMNGVPYDVIAGCRDFGIPLNGSNHRLYTLGHDPVLGWIFGVLNILSDTLSLNKSYHYGIFSIDMTHGHKRWVKKTDYVTSFADSIDSIKEDKFRLPAAVFTQRVHLKSDEFTKAGLPIPALSVFNPENVSKLYFEGYDYLCLMRDTTVFAATGLEATVAVVINMIIALIHDLLYDEEKDISRDLYEVRTRKILSLSNAISSTSNLIWVGSNLVAGNEVVIENLDIGGIIVTANRLITDTVFIQQVKAEFLEREWCNQVIGKEFSFITEAKNEKERH